MVIAIYHRQYIIKLLKTRLAPRSVNDILKSTIVTVLTHVIRQIRNKYDILSTMHNLPERKFSGHTIPICTKCLDLSGYTGRRGRSEQLVTTRLSSCGRSEQLVATGRATGPQGFFSSHVVPLLYCAVSRHVCHERAVLYLDMPTLILRVWLDAQRECLHKEFISPGGKHGMALH